MRTTPRVILILKQASSAARLHKTQAQKNVVTVTAANISHFVDPYFKFVALKHLLPNYAGRRSFYFPFVFFCLGQGVDGLLKVTESAVCFAVSVEVSELQILVTIDMEFFRASACLKNPRSWWLQSWHLTGCWQCHWLCKCWGSWYCPA